MIKNKKGEKFGTPELISHDIVYDENDNPLFEGERRLASVSLYSNGRARGGKKSGRRS